MTRRRIMLVEVTPRVPQPPVYATWGTASPGTVPTLSGGNLIATGPSGYTGPGLAVGRLSTLALSAGQWYWETTQSQSGDTTVAVGIAGLSMPDLLPFNNRPMLGNTLFPDYTVPGAVGVYSNGTTMGGTGASVPVIPNGTIVRHWLDVDSKIYRVAVAGGSWVVVATAANWPSRIVDAGPVDWPAVSPAHSFANGNPFGSGSGSVTANFGQSPFVYPVPPGVNPGVYETPDPVPLTLYFSSAPFSRVENGEGIQYSARIVGDVESARTGSCWVWGGQTESRRGSIQLVNVEGDLDHLAHLHWRDAPVRILQGYEGDAYEDFTLWAACIADNLVFSAREPRRAELVLADALAAADEPIQKETYPDDHPITADAGKPIPLVFGIPFGCSGALQSPLTVGADAFAWQIHDGLAPALTGLGTIYDNGIDITSRCVQWPASAPYKGFRVTGMAPIGKITVDASGNASTTIQTIVQNAFARLPPGKLDPMPAITLQPGGVAGLDSWAGIYIREPRTILQVMREAMDSVCGWACPTRDGSQLRLARVREPNGETPALVLTRAQIVGELAVELDTARNLTTRLAGRRNYTPHSHSEIAASISDPNSPAYNANRVAELTAEWRVICEGKPQIVDGAALSDAYAQARTAAHRGTLMQQQHHIQAEANRVCTTWYPTRHFVRLTALLDAVSADALEPGDFVQLVWPGYGLEAGAMFMVVSVRSRFFNRRVDLTLWGSLPRET